MSHRMLAAVCVIAALMPVAAAGAQGPGVAPSPAGASVSRDQPADRRRESRTFLGFVARADWLRSTCEKPAGACATTGSITSIASGDQASADNRFVRRENLREAVFL